MIDDKKYVFLHVPKTGGTYVARNGDVLKPIYDLNHSVLVNMPYTGSDDYPPNPGYLSKMRKDISLVIRPNRVCFATVRNPFDWLVSYWCHCGKDIDESTFPPPEHYDYRIARKGFDYFVRSIADRSVGWPSRKFIYFAFFAYHGDFVVDRLIHQENLDSELAEFARDSEGLQYRHQPKAMVSKNRNPDYRVYYDDRLVGVVWDTWWRELRLYGYAFEEGRVYGLLDKVVPSKTKHSLRYSWKDDLFTISGLEVI